jgi:hypothetical protein
VNNRIAFNFAVRSGMQVEGLAAQSFLKNGALLDQQLLGMKKE